MRWLRWMWAVRRLLWRLWLRRLQLLLVRCQIFCDQYTHGMPFFIYSNKISRGRGSATCYRS